MKLHIRVMDLPLSEPAASLFSLEEALIRAEYAVAKNSHKQNGSYKQTIPSQEAGAQMEVTLSEPARSDKA